MINLTESAVQRRPDGGSDRLVGSGASAGERPAVGDRGGVTAQDVGEVEAAES